MKFNLVFERAEDMPATVFIAHYTTFSRLYVGGLCFDFSVKEEAQKAYELLRKSRKIEEVKLV